MLVFFNFRVNCPQTLLPLKNIAAITATITTPCLKKTDLQGQGESTSIHIIGTTEDQGHSQGHNLDHDQGQGHQQEVMVKVSYNLK